MTVATYALGRPRPAASRGGDCRAYDLHEGRTITGPHVFAAPLHCRIINGLLRVSSGNVGTAPSLAVEAWSGAVTIDDTYDDVYDDTYGGDTADAGWVAMGTVVIDSATDLALLTKVRLVRVNPEAVTIEMVAAGMANAFVTLRRGERHVRIQHGSTRPPQVTTQRRVRWTASPSPAGTATVQRVEETAPTIDGLPRYVGAIDPATPDAGAFSLTTPAVIVARFGAGVGTAAAGDRPGDLHGQLGDASRPRIVVRTT